MAPRKHAPGTAVANWEQEMAEQAKVATETLRSGGGGGAFFSMKAGQLAFGGNPMPGNQMAVVILAATLENSYYDAAYDADTPASPRCFAFAEREDDLEPSPEVDKEEYFERQAPTCAECPRNEWGSALTGKGKACKNVMRLAMVPAGEYRMKGGRNAGFDLVLYDEVEQFDKAEIAYMKLPVMSVKNYATFVRSLAADLQRPPWGVVTNIVIEPDAKSQFKVVFELIDVLSNDLLAVTMPRHKKEQDAIAFPYGPPREDEAPVENKANAKLRRGAAATGKAASPRR